MIGNGRFNFNGSMKPMQSFFLSTLLPVENGIRIGSKEHGRNSTFQTPDRWLQKFRKSRLYSTEKICQFPNEIKRFTWKSVNVCDNVSRLDVSDVRCDRLLWNWTAGNSRVASGHHPQQKRKEGVIIRDSIRVMCLHFRGACTLALHAPHKRWRQRYLKWMVSIRFAPVDGWR
jgi:hypothetical protein